MVQIAKPGSWDFLSPSEIDIATLERREDEGVANDQADGSTLGNSSLSGPIGKEAREASQ